MLGLSEQAACIAYPDLDFDPPKRDKQAIKAAQDVCFSCPIRWECLLYAWETDIPNGIWGGAYFEQRNLMATLLGLSRLAPIQESLETIKRFTSSTRK